MPEAKSEKVKQERLWATLAHLSGFLGYVIPFSNIVAPLLIWLTKKQESEFLADHAKEATNFQISITIYSIISAILIFLAIGFFLIIALIIFEIVVIIQAAIKANNGEKYRYPLTLRFIK